MGVKKYTFPIKTAPQKYTFPIKQRAKKHTFPKNG